MFIIENQGRIIENRKSIIVLIYWNMRKINGYNNVNVTGH